MKLKIKNTNTKAAKVRVLYAINSKEKNFGLPDGISVEVVDEKIAYWQLLDCIMMEALPLRVSKSTNNRQLFFHWEDAFGRSGQFEPELTIDGKKRPLKQTKVMDYGAEEPSEWHWESEYVTQWNPKRWNIADTHETPIWQFSSFVELHIKGLQEFELEFTFIQRPAMSLKRPSLNVNLRA